MSSKIKIDHLGGYPRIQDEAPERTHDFWDEPDHESQIPHKIDVDCRNKRGDPPNIYAAFEVTSKFFELDLYPPRWALDMLVTGINKHLRNPDPEEFAKQMGVGGKYSGATNPHIGFVTQSKLDQAMGEVFMLTGGLGLSFSDAARVAVEYYELDMTHKSLMNRIREQVPDFRAVAIEKFRDGSYDPFEFCEAPEDAREEYISGMPRRARNIVREAIRKHAKT